MIFQETLAGPALPCYTEQPSALTGKMETFRIKCPYGTFI
jgi:hypothetical protein